MYKSHLEKQVGGRFALFLAAYPWIAAIVFGAAVVVQMYQRNQVTFGLTLSPVFDNLLKADWVHKGAVLATLAVLVSGPVLFLVGLVWFWLTLAAWRKSFVSGWLWLVCTILGFGGTVFFFAILGFLPLRR